jgi:hypothetical protein
MNKKEKSVGASWWREMLSRREANLRVGKISAFAGLAALVGIERFQCGDDDETTIDKDSLELQKEQGWNFGSTDKPLAFADTVLLDSKGSVDWTGYLDAMKLQNAYRNTAWQPFVVPTLAQSLSQPSLKSQLKPVNSQAMKEAYARGLGMKDLWAKSKDKANITMIVDLPGPESVAFGAALADTAELITTFDNWPHPLGVVPSHMTLAAMIYYAQEIAEKSAKRPENAPAIFLLDSNRLNAYTDADNQFDNRYVAKIPSSDALKTNHVNSVFYVVPNETRKVELDDLNADFASFKEKGMNVALLPMTNFQKPALAQDTTRTKASGLATTQPAQNVYYYGGGPSLWPYFFMHYAMTPSYRMPSYSRLPPTSIGRPSYTPTPRPTIFSSRSVGGVSGIGRQKPTGFGRVSTNVNSAGKVTSVRSGSFSRSGGRSSG